MDTIARQRPYSTRIILSYVYLVMLVRNNLENVNMFELFQLYILKLIVRKNRYYFVNILGN